MSLLNRRSTTVSASGIGRKDYSQSIEYSVEKQIRSLQERFFYSYQYTALPALVYPNVYEALLQFLVGSSLQYEAPSEAPWMFYLIEASTDTNNLIVITFNRYTSYQNYLNGNIAEFLGTSFGYLDTRLDLTKGIPTVAGSLYSIQYGVFSGADFNIDLLIHGLIGGEESL